MADLVISNVHIVRSDKQFDAPAGEAFDYEALRLDTTTAEVTPANATSAAEAAFAGLATVKATRQGQAITVLEEGLADVGDALDGMNFYDPIYLSATDGKFSTTSAGTNEVQTVTITGSPSGGTFTLTYAGQTTGTIAFNAAASAVQSALEALSTIRPGNVVVSGSSGGPYTVTFVNDLAHENVAVMTASGAGLTGGTSPAVGVTTATPGQESVICGRVWPGQNGDTADRLFYVKKEEV